MRSDQQNLFPVLNQGLFSQNYLDKKLPDSSVWRDAPGLSERTTKAMAAIRSAYKGAKRADVFDARDEQKTRNKFIRPVLKALGWLYDPQPRHRRRTKKVRPDYALFADQEEYENAGRTPDEPKAHDLRAQVVAEAKYWGKTV